MQNAPHTHVQGQAGPSGAQQGNEATVDSRKKDTRFVRRAVSPGNLADGRRISAASGPLAAAATLTASSSRVCIPERSWKAQALTAALVDANDLTSRLPIEYR
jgi:hypothetical protein